MNRTIITFGLVILLTFQLISIIPFPNVPIIKQAEAQTATSSKLVQNSDMNYEITTHEVTINNEYVYVTPAGNYSFSITKPWWMKYTNLTGSVIVSFSTFGVRYGLTILKPDSSQVTITQTTYQVNTTLLSSSTIYGYLHVLYDFSKTPMKATATFTQVVAGNFNIVWANAGQSYVKSSLTGSATLVNSSLLNSYGSAKYVYFSSSANSKQHVMLNSTDYGTASTYYGKITYNSVDYYVVLVVYGLNTAIIDPSVVQKTGGECTTPNCIRTFASSTSSGNVLVVAVAIVDTTTTCGTASVSDTQGNTYTSINSITAVGSECNLAQMWYATAQSAANTITVTYSRSLISSASGMFIYELSGVTTTGITSATGSGVGSGLTIQTSSPLSFASGAILISTMSIAGGVAVGTITAGTGFTLDQSATPNSNQQSATSGITSPTSFPYSQSGNSGTQSFSEVGAQFPAVTSRQITLNYFGRDGTTSIQSLSPRCRLEANNGTISTVTGGSGTCVARVKQDQQIRVSISLDGASLNRIKSSNTTSCCFNKWNFSINADTTYTVRTSVEVNVVMSFKKADRTLSQAIQNYTVLFGHNSTSKVISATTIPLFPTSNTSATLTIAYPSGYNSNAKNSTTINVNATSNSQVFETILQLFRTHLRAVDQDGAAISSVSVKFKFGNQTNLKSFTTNSTGWVGPFWIQNETRSRSRVEILDNTASTYNATRDYSQASDISLTSSRYSNFAGQTGKTLVVSANYTASSRTFNNGKYNWTLTAPAGLNVGAVSWQLFSFSSTPVGVRYNNTVITSPNDFTFTSNRVNSTSTNRGLNGLWHVDFGDIAGSPNPPPGGGGGVVSPAPQISQEQVQGLVSQAILMQQPQLPVFDSRQVFLIFISFVVLGGLVFFGRRLPKQNPTRRVVNQPLTTGGRRR